MRIILSFLFLISTAHAYVHSKSDTGVNLRWLQNEDFITLDVNPTKKDNQTKNITEASIIEMINDSVAQWNEISPYKITPQINKSLIGSEIATVEFSDDSSLFGSGVLAYTEVEYNNDTGNIIRAKIKINDSTSSQVSFTSDKRISGGVQVYLGDVLTHEFGHFLGLNHTENSKASMLYGPFKGQHTIHNDDREGIKKIYNIKTSNKEITGVIVAGKNVPLFGVNVQAISYSTGEVVQTVISDSNGKFSFRNLTSSDSYYFYIAPIKNKSQLPLYYSQIGTNICNGGNFKPSFFTSCQSSSKGHPSLVRISESEIVKDIGEITIRCDENLSSKYLASKSLSSDKSIDIIRESGQFGAVYTGIFFEDEMNALFGSRYDEFRLDLREEEITTRIAQGESLKLDVKLLSGGIFSAIDFEVKIKRDDQSSWTTYTTTKDAVTQKLQIDLRFQEQLSPISSENIFLIRVIPKKISASNTDVKFYELFAAPQTMVNTSNQYVINTKIVRDTVAGLEVYKLLELSPYEDNKACTEGDVRASAKPVANTDTNIEQFSENSGGPSCGTIDTGKGSSQNGPMSLLLGAVLCLLFSYVIKNSSILLSKS